MMHNEEHTINYSNLNITQDDIEAKIKIMMNSLNEKEETLRKAQIEIKLLTRGKEEILKILNEKNPNLAAEVMEMIPERESLIQEELVDTDKKEKNLTKCWVPNQKGKKFQQHDKTKLLTRLILNQSTETMYNPYEREILSFYSGDDTGISNYNHEAEDVVKIDELKEIDWQYVLVFPNPDFTNDMKVMNEKSALSLFDKFFVPDKRKTEQRANIQENMIFKNILDNIVGTEDRKNSSIVYKVNKGATMEKDQVTDKWKCVSSQAKDLQTLIRNITLYKLTKVLHFKTFTLLSQGGEYIYVLIHANDDILKNEADWQEYHLQFEIGNTDLISLEPCESKMIPFRSIINDKPDVIKKLEQETESFVKFLYEDYWENFENMKSTIPTNILQPEWEAYKTFLEYLITYKNRVISLATLYPDLKGIIARELYENGYEEVFKKNKFKLKNLWNYYEVPPTGPYKSYFREIDKLTGVDKANMFWKRYLTGKKKEISLFNSVDKIKLILICLFSQLKLDKMLSDGFLVNYFPLHSWDYNQSIEEYKKYKGDIENPNLVYQGNIMLSNEQVAEKQIKEQNVENINNNVTSAQIKDYINKKLSDNEETFCSIRNGWKFNLFGRIPATKLKTYFGEKVGFYFEFLSAYTFSLFFLGIFGIITYAIQNQDTLESKSIEFFSELGFKKSRLTIIFNTIYSFIVILWSTIFLEFWKRKEAKLATKWGKIREEETERILPSFWGKQRRSPTNDSLKEIYYPFAYYLLKKILAYFVSLIIVVIVIVIVVFLLYFRNWLVVNNVGGRNNRFIVNVPSKI